MLGQAQFFALVMVILGIEHLADHRGHIGFERLFVITGGECAKVQIIVRAARAPHAQGIDGVAIITGDRHIVGHRQHGLIILGDKVGAAVLLHGLYIAAEVHLHRILRVGHLPDIAVIQPVIGHLYLLAIHNALAEQAIFIANGAAHGRQLKRGQAVHKARGQTPQAAVAQARFRLLADDMAPVDAQLHQRVAHIFHRAQIDGVAVHAAPGQEFHRQVIQALAHIGFIAFARGHPLFHDLIADGRSHGVIDLLRGRIRKGASVIALDLADNGLLDGFLIKRCVCHAIPPCCARAAKNGGRPRGNQPAAMRPGKGKRTLASFIIA